jgi:hypothetical protein
MSVMIAPVGHGVYFGFACVIPTALAAAMISGSLCCDSPFCSVVIDVPRK